MKTIGIVAEFDPFHNGHRYLINKAKEYADTVVCVMSGNFVQRAVPALLPKEERVRAALLCGADIVLELPFVYAVSSAEGFAKNAVRILCEFGCDYICFGAEDNDREQILKTAEYLNSDNYKNEIDSELKQNISFPAARNELLIKNNINYDIGKANNILAVEYTKEILKNYPTVKIVPIKRKNAEHLSADSKDGFASAGAIRKAFLNGDDYKSLVPENCFEIYQKNKQIGNFSDFDSFSLAVLSRLRTKSELKRNAYMTEELYSRMKNALTSCTSLNELYDKMKVKHYTHSRVRRAVLCEYFDISAKDTEILPQYIRVLGFKSESSEKFGLLSKNSGLPVVSGFNEINKISSDMADRLFLLENNATDIFSLCLKTKRECGFEKKYAIVKI